MLIFGLVMVVIMVWRPRGLISTPQPIGLSQQNEDASCADSWPTRGTDERVGRDPVLDVEHLTMRFGGLVAVDDLSFNVGRGDITALIGPNGAGKTTVFNCITGFYKPTEGRIAMRHGDPAALADDRPPDRRGRPVAAHRQGRRSSCSSGWPTIEIANMRRVARTFQNIRLFGGMTVLENLLSPSTTG